MPLKGVNAIFFFTRRFLYVARPLRAYNLCLKLHQTIEPFEKQLARSSKLGLNMFDFERKSNFDYILFNIR